MKRSGLVFAILATVISADAGAIYVTTAGALRIPLSVQQAGIGGLEVVGDDPAAGWRNPSLLSGQRQQWVLSGLGGSMFGGETTNVGIAGGYKVNDRLGLALILMSSGGSFEEVDGAGALTGTTVRQATSACGVILSGKVGSALSLGATGKLVRDEVMGDRAAAPLCDLGALIHLSSVDVGVAILNMGGKLRNSPSFWQDNFPPADASVGVAWNLGAGIRLAGETTILIEGLAVERLGLEWRPIEIFAMRIGAAGPDGSFSRARGSAGLSVSWRHLQFDYAFQSALSQASHEIGLTVAFDSIH